MSAAILLRMVRMRAEYKEARMQTLPSPTHTSCQYTKHINTPVEAYWNSLSHRGRVPANFNIFRMVWSQSADAPQFGTQKFLWFLGVSKSKLRGIIDTLATWDKKYPVNPMPNCYYSSGCVNLWKKLFGSLGCANVDALISWMSNRSTNNKIRSVVAPESLGLSQ